MYHRGITFSVTPTSETGVWRWEFRIGDVIRTGRTEARLNMLAGDPVAGEVTRQAIGGFIDLFRAPRAPGVALAVAAVELDLPADQVEAQLTGYVRELLRLLGFRLPPGSPYVMAPPSI